MRPSQSSARSASSRATRTSNAPQLEADPVDGRSVLLDLHGDAVELDEQQRLGALGVAGMERRLGRLDREPVHHLDRGRQDPGRDDRRDRLAGRRRSTGTRRAASSPPRGLRTMRSVISVAIPSVPSEPMKTPSRSGPSGSSALPPSSTSSPSGSTTVEARDVVDGEAVLEAVGAARVLGHVAADRADLLARRIRAHRRSRPARPPASRRGSRRPARRRRAATARSISRIRFIRASEITIPSATGKAPPESPVPAPRATNGMPSRAQIRTTPCTSAVDAGRTTSSGMRAPAGEPVAVVHAELLGLRDHVLGPDDRSPARPRTAGERGIRASLLRRFAACSSMIDYRTFAAARTTRRGRIGVMLPIDRPGKIVCVGLNYRDHAEEQGVELPKAPLFFAKYTTSLIGPGDPIVIPTVVEQVRLRGRARRRHRRRRSRTSRRRTRSRRSPAMSSQTTSRRATCNSPTASGRAASRPTPSARSARSCRGGGPGSSRAADSRHRLRRDAAGLDTSNLIFGIDEIISYASRTSTLEAGDLILTGTPAGVGVFRDPKRLLQPGDTVTIQIDGVGEITNPVSRRLTTRGDDLAHRPP